MTNAREILALRATLHGALTFDELRDTHWNVVLNAALPAITRGWTGDELARWCIADLGSDVESAGAVIVTTLKQLGQQDPPRETTPTPQNVSEIRQARAEAVAAASDVDHAGWAARIKAGT